MQKLKKSEISRKRLLDQANHLFTENGFQATGIDEISRAVGMTSGAFYGQFKSKAALLEALVEHKIKNSQEKLLSVNEKESAFDWVQRALKMYLSSQHRDAKSQSCPLTTMATEALRIDPRASVALAEYTQYFAEVLERRLKLINPHNQNLAYPIMSMCVGAIQLARLEKNEIRSEKILKDAYLAVMKLIKTRGEA